MVRAGIADTTEFGGKLTMSLLSDIGDIARTNNTMKNKSLDNFLTKPDMQFKLLVRHTSAMSWSSKYSERNTLSSPITFSPSLNGSSVSLTFRV